MSRFIELDSAYSTTRRLRKVAVETVEAELKTLQKPEDQFETILFQSEGEERKGNGGLRTKGYFKKSSEEKSLVTVITVVLNGEKYLEETINSVLNQTHDNVEYIIIDGGSTDGTLDLVRKYEETIDYWVSEKDKGIYDAMNKGITLSQGDYIGLLNAGDLLTSDALARVAQALDALGQPGYTCGAVELIDQAGNRFGRSAPLAENLRYRRRFLEMPCPHLGVFVSKSIYVRNGLYDTAFRLSADYDFILRMVAKKIASVDINEPVGKFRSGGASGGIKTFIETFFVHRKNSAPFAYPYFAFVRSIFKKTLSKIAPTSFKKMINKKMVSKNRYD